MGKRILIITAMIAVFAGGCAFTRNFSFYAAYPEEADVTFRIPGNEKRSPIGGILKKEILSCMARGTQRKIWNEKDSKTLYIIFIRDKITEPVSLCCILQENGEFWCSDYIEAFVEEYPNQINIPSIPREFMLVLKKKDFNMIIDILEWLKASNHSSIE